MVGSQQPQHNRRTKPRLAASNHNIIVILTCEISVQWENNAFVCDISLLSLWKCQTNTIYIGDKLQDIKMTFVEICSIKLWIFVWNFSWVTEVYVFLVVIN